MRNLDISGLVSLQKHTEFATWTTAGTGVVVVTAFVEQGPMQEDPFFLPSAVLALIAFLALFAARYKAARFFSVGLVAANVVLLAHLAVVLPELEDGKALLLLAAIGFIIALYPALVCALPQHRVAATSPYLRTVVASKRKLSSLYAPGGASWIRRLSGVRFLPILVFIVLAAASIVLATFMERQLDIERPADAARNVVFILGGGLWVWAKRRSALRGTQLRRIDRRAPVLLLRSFGDDMMRIGRGLRWTAARDLRRRGMTFERMVADKLAPFGPCVAIGKPNESLAPLGAARDYVPDADWQDEVQRRMLEAAVVVLIVGTSEGLAWELLRLRDLGQLHKLILLFPPSSDVVARWRTLLARDRAANMPVLPDAVRPERALALIYADDLTPIVIEGKRDERSYESAVRIAGMLAITTGAEPVMHAA